MRSVPWSSDAPPVPQHKYRPSLGILPRVTMISRHYSLLLSISLASVHVQALAQPRPPGPSMLRPNITITPESKNSIRKCYHDY